MLTITVPGEEWFDPSTSEFITRGDVTLDLEHSLASLSKWESRHEKPFITKEAKTTEEIVSYLSDMCLTPGVPPEVFGRLSAANWEQVTGYINAKLTATTFPDMPGGKSNRVVTSEVIYFWMISYNIPFAAAEWPLQKLFALIRVCSAENTKKAPKSTADRAKQMAALNQKRLQEYQTNG